MELWEAQERLDELAEELAARHGINDRDDLPPHEDCECEECLIRAQEDEDED